ncbi:Epithelial splicing regulatory protein 2 [Intoshia linei]|uniref:Epithelial splicing regulatory protein 2 n=1 Tax=Intoshia linei TaxID=1819745 RepID=A0A177BAL2_9BILA|nr:Epithelial splicing regulatory protein 2 [Intoshia linei]
MLLQIFHYIQEKRDVEKFEPPNTYHFNKNIQINHITVFLFEEDGNKMSKIIQTNKWMLEKNLYTKSGTDYEITFGTNSVNNIITEINDILNGSKLNVPEEMNYKYGEIVDCIFSKKKHIVATFGEVFIRQLIHPIAMKFNITLSNMLYDFLNIQKEYVKFYQCYKNIQLPIIQSRIKIGNINASDVMVDNKILEENCNNIYTFVKKMMNDSFIFANSEIVYKTMKPDFLYTYLTPIPDAQICRIRGLSWGVTNADIFYFFYGLNIIRGGIAIAHGNGRKRNGEASVWFESSDHRELALDRNGGYVKNRSIEVRRGNSFNFLSKGVGYHIAAQKFLSQTGSDGFHYLVRIRNLYFSVTKSDIIDFLSCKAKVEILNGRDGIELLFDNNNTFTGDAIATVSCKRDQLACIECHKHRMRGRHVEIFPISTAEAQQLFNHALYPPDDLIHGIPMELLKQNNDIRVSFGDMSHEHLIYSQLNRPDNMIVVQGLPNNSSIDDIMEFIGDSIVGVKKGGIHFVYDSEGNFRNDAIMEIDTEDHALQLIQKKSGKDMRIQNQKFKVNLTQCNEAGVNNYLISNVFTTPVSYNSLICHDSNDIDNILNLHKIGDGNITDVKNLVTNKRQSQYQDN